MTLEVLDFDSPFSNNNGVAMLPAPFVSTNKLPKMILTFLDKYEKENQLNLHNRNIPDDEIWLELGGDKGGGNSKMIFQVANKENPNSVRNSLIFGSSEGSDTYTNLCTTLSEFKDQIHQLQTMKWRNKSIIVFLFGDYQFLTNLMGISRAYGAVCLRSLCSLKGQSATEFLSAHYRT